MFALFKDNVQISKAHSTRIAAIIEAFERKLMLQGGAKDFASDPEPPGIHLAYGYQVKEVKDDRLVQ